MDDELITDPAELSMYSQDMSRYRIIPKATFKARREDDVLRAILLARKEGLSITCRGAGSNLSGSAVGSGLILLFQKMDNLISSGNGSAVVEPGMIYDRLNDSTIPTGYFLPYHVSSSKYCTIGGNVGTKASGLRSIKYGTVDTSVTSIRFVTPAHGIVDTSGEIPIRLENDMISVREDLVSDGNALKRILEKTRVKTSSGYNLRALIDHESPRDMITHLMVGSVGTLGVFTRIHLRLAPVPSSRAMVLAFFNGPADACEAVPELRSLGPSLLELMDGFGTGIVRSSGSIHVPEGAGSALMVEFDSDIGTNLPASLTALSKYDLAHKVLTDQKDQDLVWGLRWSMLLQMKKQNETPDRRYVSFVDDLGVPVEELPSFIREVGSIFADENVPLVIYGHVGEGNLHLRPMIEKDGWKDRVERLSEKCFASVLRHGGTIAAEHGSGRNRASFIRREWGDRIYSYFKRVKDIFDPKDILNPGVMFSDKPLTEDLEF